MEGLRYYVLLLCVAGLMLLILATLIRSVLGPRFTDRIVAVNMINSMVVAAIAILALVMNQDFLVDVALVYALLSFLAVVVLARLVLSRRRSRTETEKERGETHGDA